MPLLDPSLSHRRPFLAAAALAALAGSLAAQSPASRWPSDRGIALHALAGSSGERFYEGELEVPENRAVEGGRRLRLHVIVVPARASEPKPDPIFYLAGGPGQAATELAGDLAASWMREERDLVLVDQRGTGRSNPLRVDLPGSAEDPAGYLGWFFEPEIFRRALPELEKKADLKCYTTEIAMDDLDAVREALGYEKLNLVGGSYGTRAALVYLRRHGERVRAAVLDGVAPIAFENPLHHARSAQESFDRIVAECAEDPRCQAAYPDLHGALARVLARLEKAPAELEIAQGGGRAPLRVHFTREAFCDALRVLLYYEDGNRRVPALLQRASEGDLAPFAEIALEHKRRLAETLYAGMLLCVTAAEDLPRISEEEIRRECAGTFLGEGRVRDQLAIAEFWPRGEVSAGYAEPVTAEAPVLLLSGTHDPVTPPRWGAEAASHLKRSRHVVVHGCHGVGGNPRVSRLVREFLDEGSFDALDLEGLDRVRMQGIALPDGSRAEGSPTKRVRKL